MGKDLAYSSAFLELNQKTNQLEIAKTAWSLGLIKIMGFSDEISFTKYCLNNGFVIGIDRNSIADFSALGYEALHNKNLRSNKCIEIKFKKENNDVITLEVERVVDYCRVND